MFADQIRSQIPRPVRERGEEHVRDGLVTGVKLGDNGVVGRVMGSQDCDCEIVFLPKGGGAVCGCDCLHFDDHGYCQHVWALAREADHLLKKHPERMVALLQNAGSLRPLQELADQQALRRPAPPPAEPEWKKKLRAIANHLRFASPATPAFMPRAAIATTQDPAAAAVTQPASPDRRIVYVIDQQYNLGEQFMLSVRVQRLGPTGVWQSPKAAADAPSWYGSEDPIDVHLRNHLSSAFGATTWSSSFPSLRDIRLHPLALPHVLKPACEAGRCYVRLRLGDHRVTTDDPIVPLQWDADGPYARRLHMQRGEGDYVLLLQSWRGGETLGDKLVGDRAGPYVITKERPPRIVRVEPAMTLLPQDVVNAFPLRVPAEAAVEALEQLLQMPALPPLSKESELPLPRVDLTPQPRLKLAIPQQGEGILGQVEFGYGEHGIVSASAPTAALTINTPEGRVLLTRDIAAERAHLQQMIAAGATRPENFALGRYNVRRKVLATLVAQLVLDGWHVEGEGKLYRSARQLKVKVSSRGIDWLDVSGHCDFGNGAAASLPAILAAVREKRTTLVLDDGTVGVLPHEWLKTYAPLAGVIAGASEQQGDVSRFSSRQSILLDALLAGVPEVDVDEQFRAARDRLKRFGAVTPAEPPTSFKGALRPYQSAGLGWLQFLHEFGFGGCLADDMGLGKTIQVLALLDWRRGNQAEGLHAPSLVVVPRSLIFNWKAEAAKFAPQLKVLDHSTAGRRRDAIEHLRQYDLVLTTYGTLRTDAELFRAFEFDYVILDEAQAIKNANTASSKAARLLRARHRLAMSGTPIENHLGELWSLFDFLNPGMFGASATFKLLANAEDAGGRATIARTIRPLLLRRTKQQVATDLPERVEQTIFCDLEPKQRKVYDQLRDHYRGVLGDTIAAQGIEKSQIQILEALLRLRQAACHPALIDRKHDKAGSAKLDLLIEKLEEAVDEGHKVLVFSQFTSLLALLRTKLDLDKITYEYLDGQTRDRQARVDRFQTDEACKLFLISLKAGGVGLNLTAADYVFLLDPWWNPAVEAQAIDRTHRIGQKRTVFATRLIARDTVEEKVLELQKTKRDLADQIVGEASRMSNAITREDLALLLA